MWLQPQIIGLRGKGGDNNIQEGDKNIQKGDPLNAKQCKNQH